MKILLALAALSCTATRLHAAPPAPFLDSHVHFHHRQDGDLDKVIEWMDSLGIEQVINHPLSHSRVRNEEERRRMLANYAKHKGRIHRFCVIFPGEVQTVDQAVAILRREKQDGAIGFGEHYGVKLHFDDPQCLLLFEACEIVGLPVLFHMDRDKNLDDDQFSRLQNVLRKFPKLVLIAHSDWWRKIRSGACDQVLSNYPNLYADISCTVNRSPIGKDRELARTFFTKHADKLLFGSDSGWWSLKKDQPPMPEFDFLRNLGLSPDVEEKIRRGNAIRLFRLTDPPSGKVTP